MIHGSKYDSLPKVFQMEITNTCNLHCPYCPQGRGDFVPKTNFLTISKVRDWLTRGDFDNTDRLEGLHVLGEPTLHPNYFDFISLFGGYNIPVLDATNCYMFSKKEFVDEALKAKNLKVWILGVDSSTYEEWVISKGSSYPKVIWRKMLEGLDYYLRNVTETKAIMRIILTDMTGDKDKFIETWKRYEEINSNVKIEKKFLDTFGGRYDWDKSRPTLSNSQAICPEPFRNVVILSSGDVVPCCYIYDSTILYGNLYQSKLKDIWAKSLSRRNLIGDWINKEYSQIPCSKCREWIIPSDVEVLKW